MRAVALVALLVGCSVPGKFLIDGSPGGQQDGPRTADAPPDGFMYKSGDYVWIRSMSSLTLFGIADGAAGLVVAADLSTPADIGCASGQLTSHGATDIAVVGLKDDDASCVYASSWGAGGSEFPFLDVLDSAGAPLLYGLTSSTPVDVGQGSTSPAAGIGFIGRYLPSGPAWVATATGAANAAVSASARGAGSTVCGVIKFTGTETFNGTPFASAGGNDMLVARFDTFTGTVSAAKQLGGTGDELPTAAAPFGNGGVIVAGMFNAAVSFGGTAPTLTPASGENDSFLLGLDSTDTPLWAVQIGETFDDSNPHVAVDGNGDIYVTGTFEGTLTLGGTMLTQAGTAGATHDIYVAKLSGVDRSVQWAKQISSPGEDNVRGIAVDAHGHVAVGGWVAGQLDGDTPLGGTDAVITEYNTSDGSIAWRKIISTAGNDMAFFMTYGTSGDLYAIVNMGGAYDFGHSVIGPASPASVILRIAP